MGILANGDFRPELTTIQWPASVGIANIRDVARIGVVETCVLLRRAGHPVSLLWPAGGPHGCLTPSAKIGAWLT